MKIKYNVEGVGMKITNITLAVSHTLDSDAEYDTEEQCRWYLARLTQMLHENGCLKDSQVLELLGDGFSLTS